VVGDVAEADVLGNEVEDLVLAHPHADVRLKLDQAAGFLLLYEKKHAICTIW